MIQPRIAPKPALTALTGGYRRIPVAPLQGDQAIEAVACVAEEPRPLKPVDEYLLALLAGAREHDLSPDYVYESKGRLNKRIRIDLTD